jgi:hypothetical protein
MAKKKVGRPKGSKNKSKRRGRPTGSGSNIKSSNPSIGSTFSLGNRFQEQIQNLKKERNSLLLNVKNIDKAIQLLSKLK